MPTTGECPICEGMCCQPGTAGHALALKSLDEALALFQANPPVLTKNRSGQVGNQRTRYADLVQVNAVVLSELNKLGVVYKTKPTLRAEDPKFVLAYSLRHVPSGTEEAGEYPLKLSENPMQMGSAITYARRYVLLALTGVAAEDEDDDGALAGGRRTAQRQAPVRQPAGEQPTAQRAQRQPPARPAGPPLPADGGGLSPAQRGMVQALFGKVGVQDRGARLNIAAQLAGRKLESSNELTKAEASALIDTLQKASESEDPMAAMAEALAAAAETGEAGRR